MSNQKQLLGLAADDQDDATIEVIPQYHVCSVDENQEPVLVDPLDPAADDQWQNLEGEGGANALMASPSDVRTVYTDG